MTTELKSVALAGRSAKGNHNDFFFFGGGGGERGGIFCTSVGSRKGNEVKDDSLVSHTKHRNVAVS